MINFKVVLLYLFIKEKQAKATTKTEETFNIVMKQRKIKYTHFNSIVSNRCKNH